MNTCAAPSKRIKPRKLADITFADDLTEMDQLIPFLCSAAIPKGGAPGTRGPKVEVCRKCESQCAYGRKFVHMWDAGVRPARKGAAKMPTARKSADQLTLKEQLEAKMQECMQLHEANRTMMTETLQLTKELEETKEQLEKHKAELAKMVQARTELQVELWKLKAKLYDKEHEWED